MIFTLPLDLQVLFAQSLTGLLPVIAAFLLARNLLVQLLEFLLTLAIVARILGGVAITIGVEGLMPTSMPT
jgi:hypothetical protein